MVVRCPVRKCKFSPSFKRVNSFGHNLRRCAGGSGGRRGSDNDMPMCTNEFQMRVNGEKWDRTYSMGSAGLLLDLNFRVSGILKGFGSSSISRLSSLLSQFESVPRMDSIVEEGEQRAMSPASSARASPVISTQRKVRLMYVRASRCRCFVSPRICRLGADGTAYCQSVDERRILGQHGPDSWPH